MARGDVADVVCEAGANGMSGHRKGYSLYRRKGKGPWYVTWAVTPKLRRTMKASDNKTVANEIGRAMARQADKIRGGVVTLAEAKAAQAAREPATTHVEAWAKAIKQKGNTQKHVDVSRSRVLKIINWSAAKTLPELTAERVQGALERCSTPQNARHYLTALRGFAKWCRQTGRLSDDPFLAVKMPAIAGKTFTRTAIDLDELERLFVATEERVDRRNPVKPVDRAMFYRVMAYTGLRLSEALSLTPESFHLGLNPTISVRAAYAKNRRDDSQPIPDDVAELVRP